MTGSGYIFDPQSPRDRPVMKTRRKAWHRNIDPGLEDGDGIPSAPIPNLEGMLEVAIQFRASLDPSMENGEGVIETADNIVRLLSRSFLSPDRPSGGKPFELG